MNKRALEKVPVEQARQLWIHLSNRCNANWFVSASKIDTSSFKGIVMYFYLRERLKDKNPKAMFRVFMEKNDYITQDLEENKWRISSLHNLDWSWEHNSFCVDTKSEKAIKQFLGKKLDYENMFEGIAKYQSKVMAARLEKKHKVIKDRIDKKMKTVPKLPKDFNEWADEIALYKSRYIYYQYKSTKKLQGYCTHCKQNVIIDTTLQKPRHNKEGVCPNCKSPIIFKAAGKSKNVFDEAKAAVIQKTGDGIVLRYFSIYKRYSEDYRKPILRYFEDYRDFYEHGKIQYYVYKRFKMTNEVRWCENPPAWGYSDVTLYERNLDNALKGTRWEYSAIKQYATVQPGYIFNVDGYLRRYYKLPALEYMVKLGLNKIVKSLISYNPWVSYNADIKKTLNTSGHTFQQVLKVGKEYLPVLQRMDATIPELQVIQCAQANNVLITDEQIRYIAQEFHPIEDFFELTRFGAVNKLIKYIQKQAVRYHSRLNSVMQDWNDYIENCKVLGYNLKSEFIVYPKNLKERHDLAYNLVKKKANELYDKAIREMYEEVKEKFSWDSEEFAIIVPRNAFEICHEGEKLHHCVGTYVERVAKGKTNIVFLRKKEQIEKPFYTLEIRNGVIVQSRGFDDVDPTDDVKKAIDRFKTKKLNLAKEAA